jgi:hypothetical protein
LKVELLRVAHGGGGMQNKYTRSLCSKSRPIPHSNNLPYTFLSPEGHSLFISCASAHRLLLVYIFCASAHRLLFSPAPYVVSHFVLGYSASYAFVPPPGPPLPPCVAVATPLPPSRPNSGADPSPSGDILTLQGPSLVLSLSTMGPSLTGTPPPTHLSLCVEGTDPLGLLPPNWCTTHPHPLRAPPSLF